MLIDPRFLQDVRSRCYAIPVALSAPFVVDSLCPTRQDGTDSLVLYLHR